MPITTSRIGVVTDALVTALKASPTFADPARVYDGPQTAGDTMWTQAVYVGFDGEWANNIYAAVDLRQDLNYLGNTSMFEEFDIWCVAEAWAGDVNTKTARDQCLAMFAGVQTVLRTDPTLGVDGSTITGLTLAGQLRYEFDTSGNILARLPFQIHVVTTLLTT
jgi:hypothetical protein